MRISLIYVPYHLGRKAVGMGLGPIKFKEAGIERKLSDQGHDIISKNVELKNSFIDEKQAIVSLNKDLRNKVEDSINARYFPLILGGNCNTCLGILSGINDQETGIIWFDAHGDFNTPEITPSGFFDGMPFAIATGQCYTELWSQIADINPIKESNSLHIGNRDLDPKERDLLESTRVGVVEASDIKRTDFRENLKPVLSNLQSKTRNIYLHIDIDVLDPSEAPGVDYPSPNGLFLYEIEEILKMISEKFVIKAAALTAYNPSKEKDDTTLKTGFNLINTLIQVKSKILQIQ